MAKTYLETLARLIGVPVPDVEILKWTTRGTRFPEVPEELSFLHSKCVDLGFENLSLSDDEYKALLLAFVGEGVAVPGSPYKLRYTGMGMSTVVEPATGQEPSLPAHWKQGVRVMDKQDRFSWIGKRVRPNPLGQVNLALYQDVGDGWQLRPDP